MQQKILQQLSKFSETELINEIVLPLVSELHPGRLEYTHSSLESGRDIVSFGTDKLRRQHTLCIQVKAKAISYSAIGFGEVDRVSQSAKKNGITLENGRTIIPHEVWFLTSYPFPEQNRRQVSQILEQMEINNIKFVSGEELSYLIMEHLPEIAAKLIKYSEPAITELVSFLSIHREGRAFGFAYDRNIYEFYISTSLSPHTKLSYYAFQFGIKMQNISQSVAVPIRKLITFNELWPTAFYNEEFKAPYSIQALCNILINDYDNLTTDIDADRDTTEWLNELLCETTFYEALLQNKPALTISVDALKLESKTRSARSKAYHELNDFSRTIIRRFNRLLIEEAYDETPKGESYNLNFEDIIMSKLKSLYCNRSYFKQFNIMSDVHVDIDFSKSTISKMYLNDEKISATVHIYLKEPFKLLMEDMKTSFRNCSHSLCKNVNPVKKACINLQRVDKFLSIIMREFDYDIGYEENCELHPLRINVSRPEYLIKLGHIVLIEGVPGCGKTTLLKILALRLIEQGKKIFFVPCCSITQDYKNKSLEEIIRAFCYGAVSLNWKLDETVLLLDGLDEAPFDLGSHIVSDKKRLLNIVATVRTAYSTVLREQSFHIAIAPFTTEERDQFFEKWFSTNSTLLDKTKTLLSNHSDLNNHSRLPLIATLIASLIEADITPSTRAEIYGYRIDLLLNKWDRAKGVRRLYVLDRPDAKRRFLQTLAFFVHSSDLRKRTFDMNDLETAYAESLGNWAYNYKFDKIIDDLLVGSGLIVQDRPGLYSFGHLSFQEHLAGEYIAKKLSLYKIALLLGSDWWEEPLNFYASILGDISELLEYLLKDGVSFHSHREQLKTMIYYAPYTNPGVIDCLRKKTMREGDELDDL